MANDDNWWENPDGNPTVPNPWDQSGWNPYDPYNQAPQPPGDGTVGTDVPTPPTQAGPPEDPGTGGAPSGGGGYPTRPSSGGYAPVPQFHAPVFSYDKFVAPSAADALNEPGYQFRLSEGERALQQSAAGRGNLRTGGTLKDILGYGQNYASQEYQNVYNRALQNYGTNFNTAASVFDRNYTGAKDEYAPNLLQWQFLTNAEQRAREAEYQAAIQKWMHDNLSAYEYGQLVGG